MITLKTLLPALALAATAGTASADCTSLGTLGPPGAALFGNSFSASGTYTDCYTFQLLSGANSFGGMLESWDPLNKLSIDVKSISLSGGTLASTLTDWTPTLFDFGGLGAGTYTLSVLSVVDTDWGLYRDKVGYLGGIATVAAIPEPETYALMLLGLAAIGAFTRRRQAAR